MNQDIYHPPSSAVKEIELPTTKIRFKEKLIISVLVIIPFSISFSIPASDLLSQLSIGYFSDFTFDNIPAFVFIITSITLLWLLCYFVLTFPLRKKGELLRLFVSGILIFFAVMLVAVPQMGLNEFWPPWEALFGFKILTGLIVGLVLGSFAIKFMANIRVTSI